MFIADASLQRAFYFSVAEKLAQRIKTLEAAVGIGADGSVTLTAEDVDFVEPNQGKSLLILW